MIFMLLSQGLPVAAASVSRRPEFSPGGFLYVPCEMNGSAGSCLLDTGAGRSMVARSAAKGLPRGLALQAGLAGGVPEFIFSYRVSGIRVLDGEIPDKTLPAKKAFPFPDQPGDLVGVAGGDMLAGRILAVDKASSLAEFRVARPAGECAPLLTDGGSPMLEISSGGRKLLALLDTAAGASFADPSAAGLAEAGGPAKEVGDAAGKKRLASASSLEVSLAGRTDLLRVLVMQGRLPKIKGRQVDVILGTDYLFKRPFVLDYLNGQFCFQHRDGAGLGFDSPVAADEPPR